MATLTWNNDRNVYTAELNDGRTLVVDGDAFAEARHDSALAYLKEAHPELSKDELEDLLCNSEEGDKMDTQAFNELIDASEWEPQAQEVDEEGFPPAAATAWLK